MDHHPQDPAAAHGPPPPFPPRGDPSVTEMRPGAGAAVRPLLAMLPVLGMFFVVLLLLGSILFESLAPGTGMAGGTAVGAVGALGSAVLLWRRFAGNLRGTVVLASPVGVELTDPMGFHVRLRWVDTTEVGPVDTAVADPRGVRAGAGTRRVAAKQVRQLGLIGYGERTAGPGAPAWQRNHLAQQPRDPRTGLQLLGLPFAAAGPDGLGNPLRAYARRMRPDLSA
ncbi:hypothetical protein [Nocardiopsis coralliicola]